MKTLYVGYHGDNDHLLQKSTEMEEVRCPWKPKVNRELTMHAYSTRVKEVMANGIHPVSASSMLVFQYSLL